MVTGDGVRGCETLPGKSDVMVSMENCGSSSSARAGFGCRVQTHTATRGGGGVGGGRDKNKCQPFGEGTIPHTGSEGGLAGKYESHPLPQTLGTCSRGNLSVCRKAAPARAVYCVVTALAAIRACQGVWIDRRILSKSKHRWERKDSFKITAAFQAYLKKRVSFGFRCIRVSKIAIFWDVILFSLSKYT